MASATPSGSRALLPLLLLAAATVASASPGALRGGNQTAADATPSGAPEAAAAAGASAANASGSPGPRPEPKPQPRSGANATNASLLLEAVNGSNASLALEPEALAEWHGGGAVWHGPNGGGAAWHGGGHPGNPGHPGSPGGCHGGGGFCTGRSANWFCMGTTHVQCCHGACGFYQCGSVANYHGCGYAPPPPGPPATGGYASFCAARRSGWFCYGKTRVKCCQKGLVWTSCETMTNYHGCF